VQEELSEPALEGQACVHFTRLPWRMYDVPSFTEPPAPTLGQHSESVLRALGGCGPSTFQQLVRDGVVVGAAPPQTARRPV
jgi:hypothetical protein